MWLNFTSMGFHSEINAESRHTQRKTNDGRRRTTVGKYSNGMNSSWLPLNYASSWSRQMHQEIDLEHSYWFFYKKMPSHWNCWSYKDDFSINFIVIKSSERLSFQNIRFGNTRIPMTEKLQIYVKAFTCCISTLVVLIDKEGFKRKCTVPHRLAPLQQSVMPLYNILTLFQYYYLPIFCKKFNFPFFRPRLHFIVIIERLRLIKAT